MNLKLIPLVSTMAVMLSTPVLAAPSINDMQSCQGVLDFVEGKLDVLSETYPAADLNVIRVGLKKYNAYIQKEIVAPGLKQYSGGDESKAKALQTQVDAYKSTLVSGFSSRYPEKRLYSDHAVAINNCAKQAVPSGQALDDLKAALTTIVTLSKSS